MEGWFGKKVNLVEAIEEGRIVLVTEEYARREELPVLRNSVELEHEALEENIGNKSDDGSSKSLNFVDYCSSLKKKEGKVAEKELISNFHWTIVHARRTRNMTRRQLAHSIGVPIQSLKLIENGVLPREGIMMVRKLEEALRVKLRKDNVEFSQPMRRLIEGKSAREDRAREAEILKEEDSISGDEIELDDE